MLKLLFPSLLLLGLSYTAHSQGNSSLDVSAGAGFAFRSLSYSGDEQTMKNIFQDRQDRERLGSAWHAGFHYNHQLGGQFFLRTGLRLTRIGYVNAWITDLRWGHQHDGNGGFTNDPSLVRDLKTTTSYSYVELPIAGRYEFGSGRWSPFVEVGLSPALYHATYTIRTIDTPQPRLSRSREESIRDLQLIGSLSAGCAYRLSPNWQVFGQPTFRYHLTPLAEGPIQERLFSYGLELGIRRAL